MSLLNRLPQVALLLTALAGAVTGVPCSAKEGFSMIKTTATLQRTNPPEIYIPGTRIQVRATSSAAEGSSAAQQLQSLLESRLLNSDKRFSVDAQRPQTLIEATVVENSGSDRWDRRKVLKLVPAGKDEKGKQKYESREVEVRYRVLSHRLVVAYKVTENPSRHNLAANTWSEEYNKDFAEGNGAPEPATIEGELVETIVGKIVHQLAPTKEEVGVLLPEGSLKNLNNLAKGRLWGNYLEALELLAAKPSPRDESYRQYALGVANEALAYAAEDIDATLRYLQEASSHYNQALQSNSEEKFFARPFDGWAATLQLKRNTSAPLERVQTSLVKYQKLKNFRDAPQQAQAAAVAAGSKGLHSSGKAAQADPDLLDNAGVISMVQAGLSDDIVINAIKTTEKKKFDLSPKGLIDLSQANVSEKVIQTLQGLTQKKPAKKK
jgi:hypothetical protein